jgi:uncharacterized protein (TIGR03083 family)
MMPEQSEAAQRAAGPPDGQLHDWYLSGLDALVSGLASADPGMPAWTFLPAPSPLAFWARRQAHETAIHRADAELAAGSRPSYPAELAADGVDELLTGFTARQGSPGQRRPAPGRLLASAHARAVGLTSRGTLRSSSD